MPLDGPLPSSRNPRRELLLSVAPFVGIPLVILTYVVGLYGLTAALLGAGVLWMFVPGFVAGSAAQHWGGEPTPWGRIRYRFTTDYTGWAARVATGRYVLVGLVLVVGGIIETADPGWTRRLFADGPGWPLVLVGVGLVVAASGVVALAPGTDSAGAPRGVAPLRWLAAVGKVLQVLVGVALVAAGVIELSTGGALSRAIRDLNPLGPR